MDVSSLGFRTDLALLTLAGAQIEDRGTHLVVRSPRNPTFRWGNFHLLPRPPEPDEIEDLLTAYDVDFDGSDHRAFGIDGIQDLGAALGPLADIGFEVEVSTVLTASLVHPPPRPNTEADVRALGSADDWAQQAVLTVEANRGEGPGEDPDELAVFATRKAADDRAVVEAGHGRWFGAFVDGRLASSVGLIDAGSGLARYQAVQTHPDYRRAGLAGTLVHRVGRYGLDELGAHTLVMLADPDYPAIGIYRSVGFVPTEIATQAQQRKRPTSPRSPARP